MSMKYSKAEKMINDGWKIIMAVDTSSEPTSPDAHGVSYGGQEVSIIAEREYDKPRILAGDALPRSKPCNPPMPGGR